MNLSDHSHCVLAASLAEPQILFLSCVYFLADVFLVAALAQWLRSWTCILQTWVQLGWHLYESLMAVGRASGLKLLQCASKVLPILVSKSET